MEITATAWTAGMAGAHLYLIFAWPLAKLFSYTRLAFMSFQMKVVAALVIGVVSAPLAERYAPFLKDQAEQLILKSDYATQTYYKVASMLHSRKSD